jgi:glycosyltransferase involved in cell wall biosynthesis
MQQLAQSSSLFGSRTCEVIRYYLDPTVFKPLDRTAARRVFNLPDDRPIILMGAIRSTFDPRKGYRHLKEAADILGTLQWPEKPLVVVFGSPSGSADQALSLETRFFGRLDDDTSLALLYSAGDVTVVPSLEEAFGLTALESSACGTPVVAFDVGGLGDTVKHNQTGYLAKPLDTADLARGIRWVLEDDQRRRDLGNQARERVLQAFSARESLRGHLDLYKRLLATVGPRSEDDSL